MENDKIDPNDYLTIRRFAEQAGLTTQGIRDRIKNHQIMKVKKMGVLHIHKSELAVFKSKQKVKTEN